MTLELQHRLEDKLKTRPLFDDLPQKIIAVQDNLQQLVDNKKISNIEQNEIKSLLNEMRMRNEKDL